MTQAVVDASVAVKWVVDEPLSTRATVLPLRYELIAPSLLYAEVASAMAKGVSRGDLSPEAAARRMRGIVHSGVEVVPDEYLCVAAVQLAAELGHSVYDCFYLALAIAREVPLVTADRKLVAAAHAAGHAARVVSLEDVG